MYAKAISTMPCIEEIITASAPFLFPVDLSNNVNLMIIDDQYK